MSLSRRRFLLASAASVALWGRVSAANQANTSRLEGLLIGSLIGDALGGPIEFLSADRVQEVMPGARKWDAEKRSTRNY